MKKAMLVAACFIVLGLVICFAGFFALDYDISKLNTADTVASTHTIAQSFSNIEIDGTYTNIIFWVSEDENYQVSSRETEGFLTTVTVENETLYISQKDSRKWYQKIGFNHKGNEVALYLPEGAYGDLKIRTDVGNVVLLDSMTFENADIQTTTGYVEMITPVNRDLTIRTETGGVYLEDITALNVTLQTKTGTLEGAHIGALKDVRLKTTTGKIDLAAVECENFSVETTTGNVLLNGVICTGRMNVETDTGNIRLVTCDAAGLKLESDTGDITASLLTGKLFEAESDTGTVRIPASTPGGKCELSTDTGDISVTIN